MQIENRRTRWYPAERSGLSGLVHTAFFMPPPGIAGGFRLSAFPCSYPYLVVNAEHTMTGAIGKDVVRSHALFVHSGLSPYELHVPEKGSILNLRFLPDFSIRRLGYSGQELVGKIIPLEILNPRFADALVQWAGAFSLGNDDWNRFEQLVSGCFRHRPPPDRQIRLRACIRQWLKDGVTGEGDNRWISSLGISRRRLQQMLVEDLGLSQSRLARVFRFNRFMRAYFVGNRKLADTALDSGYYDQPHFCREVRLMTGMTPLQLHGYLSRHPAVSAYRESNVFNMRL